MSIVAVRAVFDLRDDRLTASDRYVLLNFAEHSNAETTLAWPSAPTVADETGLGLSTVERAVSKLRSLGYLTKTARHRVGEHAWVWVYRVSTAVPKTSTSPRCEGTSTPRPLTDANDDPSQRGVNRKEEPEVKDSATTSRRNEGDPVLVEVASADDPPKPVSLDRERQSRVWDCLVAGWGWVGPLTASARGQIARASKELREIGATPDEITDRAERFARARRRRPSPIELVRDWGMYAPQPGEGSREPWLWR